ncbi:hypothetical protein GCM10009718_02480 [Isoptericola halotolerans]|uniref:Uncharacterized protein n=1 Tax=Isoptericola halotolerans TaxID=300560 RepID=A0ABX2A1V1_9MICO|nr:hypothetical protein [Isoptericola halotolerans]NOV96824.1 hypothetical protein [Isoptericola halotolerans]
MTATTFTDADRKALVDRYPVNQPKEVRRVVSVIDDPVRAEEFVQSAVPTFPAPDATAPDWAEDAEPWSWWGNGDGWRRSLSVTAVVPGFASAVLTQTEVMLRPGALEAGVATLYVDVDDAEEAQTPENIMALAEGLQRLATSLADIQQD